MDFTTRLRWRFTWVDGNADWIRGWVSSCCTAERCIVKFHFLVEVTYLELVKILLFCSCVCTMPKALSVQCQHLLNPYVRHPMRNCVEECLGFRPWELAMQINSLKPVFNRRLWSLVRSTSRSLFTRSHGRAIASAGCICPVTAYPALLRICISHMRNRFSM